MPRDTVNMCFSLSPRAAAYVKGAGKGRQSALVDRCILFCKDNQVEDLFQNISGLQDHISKLYKELDEVTGSSEIPDEEAQKVSPSRGLKRFFKFMWG